MSKTVLTQDMIVSIEIQHKLLRHNKNVKIISFMRYKFVHGKKPVLHNY